MNILIITPFYKQDKNIASVRWTKLAPRLAKHHNITVVTQPFDDMDMKISTTEEDGVRIIRANQKSWYEKFSVKYLGGATGNDWQTKSPKIKTGKETIIISDSWKRRLKNRLIYSSFKSKAIAYAKWISKFAIHKNVKIDVVISSACPFIEMLFGYELKKILGCKWICEFRDLPFSVDNCDDTHKMRNIMADVFPSADAVVTIAPTGKTFLQDIFTISEQKVNVITNGFSLSDAKETKTLDDGVLHLVHTGNIYMGRKCDLLFKALKVVRNNRPDIKIQFDCAGGNTEVIRDCAEQYGLIEVVKDYGFVSRDVALALQAQADALLVFACTKPGTLTAKLFEYMLWKKPVICINSADVVDCDESIMIKQCKLGIAVAEASGDKDINILADYLIRQYDNKLQKHELDFNATEDDIKQFDHDNIAIKIEQLINNI